MRPPDSVTLETIVSSQNLLSDPHTDLQTVATSFLRGWAKAVRGRRSKGRRQKIRRPDVSVCVKA